MTPKNFGRQKLGGWWLEEEDVVDFDVVELEEDEEFEEELEEDDKEEDEEFEEALEDEVELAAQLCLGHHVASQARASGVDVQHLPDALDGGFARPASNVSRELIERPVHNRSADDGTGESVGRVIDERHNLLRLRACYCQVCIGQSPYTYMRTANFLAPFSRGWPNNVVFD